VKFSCAELADVGRNVTWFDSSLASTGCHSGKRNVKMNPRVGCWWNDVGREELGLDVKIIQQPSWPFAAGYMLTNLFSAENGVFIQKLVVAQLLIVLPVVRHCNHKSPPPVPVPHRSSAAKLMYVIVTGYGLLCCHHYVVTCIHYIC